MCSGGGKLIEQRFDPDKIITGVIVCGKTGHLFYTDYSNDIDKSRCLSRNLTSAGAQCVTVYSGLPRQLQTAIKNLNRMDFLPGYDPIKEFKRVDAKKNHHWVYGITHKILS